MKKAMVIVAAVAGYVLLETTLLLSVIVPQPWSSPGRYQKIVLCAQVLLIPGMAAVFSRIMYGSFQWRRRTLTILLAGSLGVPIAMIMFFIPVIISIVLLAWAFAVHWVLFAVLLPLVLGAIMLGLLLLVRKSGKWSVQAEANRWLAERHSESTQRECKWRNRGIRFALCLPVLTVLPVFLFLPETWGVFSHVGQWQSGNLSGYRVPVPAA